MKKKGKKKKGKGKGKGKGNKKDGSEHQYKMAPLYLFLASSLNVELVYIILTSITQFAYLRRDERGNSTILDQSNRSYNSQSSDSTNVEIVEERGGDAVLRLSEIKIQDPSKWTKNAKMEDYIQDSKIFTRNIFRSSENSISERRSTTLLGSTSEIQMITL